MYKFLYPIIVLTMLSGCTTIGDRTGDGVPASSTGAAADGLVRVKSPRDAKDTMDRFEAAARKGGMKVFARIDHAAGAVSVDKALRPTEVLVFGNPKGGTALMGCAQSIGIDLPMKALVWEDESGQVWLAYNDPAYLTRRHAVPDCPVVDELAAVLADLSNATVAP